jgi:4-amino-4-deoxy-L-arabinose transferase-like glycosyltransferase
LQATAMFCFGVSEWAVRFFPALYGIAGCLAVYLAGRRLFNRLTGWLAAIILATTPLYFSGSHYANLDLEVAVLITASLLSFMVATLSHPKPRTGFFLLAYLFAGLGFLTKGMIAIAFPVMIGGLWILLLSRWSILRNMRLITGIIIVAVINLPWFMLVQEANPEFLHFFFVTQQVTRFLSAADFNNPSSCWFYIPIVMIGFLPWTIFIAQTKWTHICNIWQARQTHAAELFLLLWATVIVVFFSIPHSKTISYILPVFPPLALLTAKYIADHWQDAVRARGITAAIALLIVMDTLFAALFFALPNHWIVMPIELTTTLFAIGLELGIAALITLVMRKNMRTPQLFYICAMTSAVVLLTIVSGARFLNPNSAKPLVKQLQPLLKPGNTVVNYFKFYQDIPMYLGRTIILVADWKSPDIANRDNWVRELWYSMPFQNTDEILWDETTFWKRWHSKEKMFVFLNENYLEQFQTHTRKYFLIGQYHDIILVSNKK